MINKRFYITPNMSIATIQKWQNGHWIFDRWPTSEEIKQEKVLKYNYHMNKEFNNRNRIERKCKESIIISDELETYTFHPIPHISIFNVIPETDSKISQLTKDLYDWQECGMGLHQPYNMPKYCKCCGRRL